MPPSSKRSDKIRNNGGKARNRKKKETSSPNSKTYQRIPRNNAIQTTISIIVIILAYGVWKHQQNQTFFSRTGVDDSKTENETKIQNFISWLKDNGAIISPRVTLESFPEFGGYGLKAKSKCEMNNGEKDELIKQTCTIDDNDTDDSKEIAIQYFDEMFTIPESIIMSTKSILHEFTSSNFKISNFQSRMTKLLSGHIVYSSYMVQQDVVIALYLMTQCALDDKSRFKPYMDILPQYNIPRLDTFDDDELAMLQDDFLSTLAKESLTQLQSIWDSNDLHKILSEMMKTATYGANNVNKDTYSQCMSFSSFHKFVSIVSSRAMVVQGHKYLTPFAEFANYQARVDDRKQLKGRMNQSFLTYHARDQSNGSITVRADRNVHFGQQIFEDYGDIDNSLYLEAHGFIPDENPFHCAMIPMALVPDPRQLSIMTQKALVSLKLLPEVNGGESHLPSVCILDDGSISDSRANAYLTVAALDFIDENELVRKCREALSIQDDELIQLQCLHYENHYKYVQQFIEHLSAKTLCASATTLEDDMTLLNSILNAENRKKDMAKKLIALKFRIADKKILYYAAGGMHNNIDCSLTQWSLSYEAMEEADPAILLHESKGLEVSIDNNEIMLKQFNAFIDGLDLPVRKIEARFVGDMRLGVVATEDISEGDIYLSINSSSVMNQDTATSGKTLAIDSVLDRYRYASKDGGFMVLLLFLMHEKFIAKDESSWHAYIDLLPNVEAMKTTSPIFFDEILFDYATGSDLRMFLLRTKRKAEESFVQIQTDTNLLKIFGQHLKLDNFLWAYSIVHSRSIWWDGKRNLVPLLDLVNCLEQHSANGLPTSVHKTHLDESKHAITMASKSFKKDEEVFENYGHPNHVYFMYHGFSLGKNNSHDCAHWGGFGIESQEHSKSKLSDHGFVSNNPSFCVRDLSSLDRVAEFLRIKYGLENTDESMGGLSSDVLPLVRKYLVEKLHKYKVSKRSTNRIPKGSKGMIRSIQTMLDIVDEEKHFLEVALNELDGINDQKLGY